MSTIYITSNADSGDGTLRAVIAASGNNDIITPYPGLELVVEPSSPIPLESNSTRLNITLNGDRRLTIRRNSSFSAQLMTIARGAQNGQTLVENVKFENSQQTAARKCLYLQNNGTAFYQSEIVFDGCSFAGHTNTTGAICNQTASQIANQPIIFKNCAFLGNRSTSSATLVATGGALFVVTIEGARCLSFVNCSFIGNLTRYIYQFQEYAGEIVDCKQDNADLVAGPPSNWSSTWTPTAWQSWNPHILNSSPQARGYNSTGARYDAEGVARVNGTLGAFETVDADLYWVGKDANGDDVTTPSMESADGWADDRWATTSGATLPSDVASLFVGETVDFTGTWAPTNGGEITTGAGAVSIATQAPADTSRRIVAHIGAGGLSVSGAVALTNGDDLGSLTPVSPVVVDVLAPATVGSYTIAAGVTLSVVSATFSALTIDGGALKISETATVSGAFALTAGTIELKSEGAILSTAGTVTLTAGAITSTARAYWNLPAATAVSSIEIGENIIRINASAGASNFLAETTGEIVNFTWSAASGEPSTLEKVSPYQMIDAAAVASNPPTTTVYAPTTFRLWSGSEWLTAVASPRLPSYLWTVEPWALALADVEDVAYNVVVWGLNPNITHNESEETTGED